MKKNIFFILLSAVLLMWACDDSLPEVDDRMLGVDVSFEHINPVSGESESNVFEGLYRKENMVKIALASPKIIDKISVVSTITGDMLETRELKGNSASFEYSIASLNIPFGQSTDLVFYLYYDDNGESGFDYPSMKSISYKIISDVPSVVNFKKSDGSVEELSTIGFNVSEFYELPLKGVTASFKADENSFLEVANSPLLKFGAAGDFSVSFWVKSDHEISDPAMMGTMDWNSGDNQGWVIAWRNGKLRVVATSDDPEVSKCDFREEGDLIPSMIGTEWYFITVSFDRDEKARIFRNGVETVSGSMTPGNLDNGTTVKINQDGTGDYGNKLGADYSNVVFYDYALTEAQALAIYDATK